MFGYINPDAPYLFKKDETLYKALYCGLCKSIGKGCGQKARTSLTYDMAFFAAILHNIAGEDVKIIRRRCCLHWIRRRPVVACDDIMLTVGKINATLAYFKLTDDKKDGDKKGILRRLYYKAYKITRKTRPDIVEIIERHTAEQDALEKRGCAVIDEAAEPSALMMKELSALVLGGKATADTDGLFYDLGKWVYLIDAVDDYDKDVKKGAYNVLFNAFGEKTRAEMAKSHEKEMVFLFDALFADMRERLFKIKFYFNRDLTDNIILRGIPVKTRALFYGGAKKVKNEQKES